MIKQNPFNIMVEYNFNITTEHNISYFFITIILQPPVDTNIVDFHILRLLCIVHFSFVNHSSPRKSDSTGIQCLKFRYKNHIECFFKTNRRSKLMTFNLEFSEALGILRSCLEKLNKMYFLFFNRFHRKTEIEKFFFEWPTNLKEELVCLGRFKKFWFLILIDQTSC